MKPPHFLVFARPRSRTAWLANFLTHSGTYCAHEPLADCASMAELGRALEQPFRYGADVQRVGFADTSLIHAPERALDAFPHARAIMVLSDGKAWRRFAKAQGFPPELVATVDAAYDRTHALLIGRAYFLEAGELTSSARTARSLWDLTHVGSSFPMERWRMLRGLNVQVDAGDLAGRIRRTVSG